MTTTDSDALRFASYPTARPPDRQRTVNSSGLSLAVYEWGDLDAPPLLLVHGAFDFARTFDVFAPLLADAGYRVVSHDQRGHGDSDHAALYSWAPDERDMLAGRAAGIGWAKCAGSRRVFRRKGRRSLSSARARGEPPA